MKKIMLLFITIYSIQAGQEASQDPTHIDQSSLSALTTPKALHASIQCKITLPPTTALSDYIILTANSLKYTIDNSNNTITIKSYGKLLLIDKTTLKAVYFIASNLRGSNNTIQLNSNDFSEINFAKNATKIHNGSTFTTTIQQYFYDKNLNINPVTTTQTINKKSKSVVETKDGLPVYKITGRGDIIFIKPTATGVSFEGAKLTVV